jgi:outer membrane biosynthesis protein TonB
MHLGGASKRVPALEALIEMPPPRRSWWPALLLLVCLALAGAAASLYRSQGLPDLTARWKNLRTMLPERLPSATPASVPASSPEPQAPPPAASLAPPQETPPPPIETGPVQAPSVLSAPAPVPKAAPAPPKIPPAAKSAPQPPPAPQAVPAPRETVPATPPPTATVPRRSDADAKAPAAAAPGANAPAGPTQIELSADHYTVQPGDSAAHIVVRRSGGARGEVRFAWWTENGSASADLDFVAWGRRVERIAAGQSSVTLLVPLIKDATRNGPRSFAVLIGSEGNGARLGGITRATVQLPGHN